MHRIHMETAQYLQPDSTPNFDDISATGKRYNLRSQCLEETQNDFRGNRIINMGKMLENINTLIKGHSGRKCRGADKVYKTEYKHGLAIKLQFHCRTCGYESQMMKMYDEIPKTTRATISTNLAVALLDTPMGTSRAEDLLSQLDLPFPATSYLQKLSVEVSSKVTEINRKDMAEKRDLVRRHNINKNVSDPKQIDVSTDARYNWSRMKSSYKPGQSSSQAYAIASENHTDSKYITGLDVENKLCWTGAALKNKGFKISCPGGHAGCTADIAYLELHSERRMAYDIADDLSLEGFYVRTLTTDGDTWSYLGMQDFYDKLSTSWELTRRADPYHLAATRERKTRNADFSKGMFPFPTKKERQPAKAALARDIKQRCNAVVEEMARRGKGDITTMFTHLPSIRNATVECYAGNCSNCPTDFLVCSGEGAGCWWYKSNVLGPAKITLLRMDKNDKSVLQVILQMRLSEAAVYSVSSQTSTQKCEAFNRATAATLSKSISYSRTFTGRLSAQILRSNNRIDRVVKKKLWTVSGTSLCIWAQKRLQKISRRAIIGKSRKKTNLYKKKRQTIRARLEYEHRAMQERGYPEPDYVKGLLDDNIHTYAQRPKQVKT